MRGRWGGGFRLLLFGGLGGMGGGGGERGDEGRWRGDGWLRGVWVIWLREKRG